MKKIIYLTLFAISLLGCDCVFTDDGGFVYDDSRGPIWCPDGDGDGFLSRWACRNSCTQPGPEYERVPDQVPDAAAYVYDCDDAEAEVYPGAQEICDYLNNDCEEQPQRIDEAPYQSDASGYEAWIESGATLLYPDRDSDSWGDSSESVMACPGFLGPGWTSRGGDCNDAVYEINPGAGTCPTDVVR